MSSSELEEVSGVGELVWADVRNPLENRASTGKMRPVVLVQREGGHYRTMGLTTQRTYGDGTPRVAIPNPRRVGLRGPGFLWGDKLTNVSVLDIGDHIGWSDAELAEAIITLARLGNGAAAGLRAASVLEHAGAGGQSSESVL
jgi:hypothetical protein